MRNVLLLQEPTLSGTIATNIACDIAMQGNCNITGLQIQEPGSTEGVGISARARLNERIGESESSWSSRHITLNEKTLIGPKFAMLSQEAEAHDLTLLGREGNFEEHASRSAKEVITLLLKYRASPLIIAPANAKSDADILVTYDGSPRASRAVRFLGLLGLAEGKNIHVLCIDHQRRVAEAKVEMISEYLRKQNACLTGHAVASRANASEVIFDKITELDTSLVVSGALASSGWRRGLLGSVSDYLIRHCPVPLFTCP